MRHCFAAFAGLFAAVGFASAQAPAPMPIPVRPAQVQFTPAGNFANPADAAQFQQTSAFVAASGIDTRMECIVLLSLKMVPRVDSRFCTVASDHTY